MDQPTYNAGYAASLPPNISALMRLSVDCFAGTSTSGRTAGFTLLAQQGYAIDEQIMVMGDDAYAVMQERNQYGYTSVLAFLAPKPTIQVPPGVTFNGITGLPNQGTVIVYWPSPPPPFSAPPPSQPPAGLTLGIAIGNDFPNYYEMNGDSANVPINTSIILGTFKYTKQIITHSPFATGWLQQPN